MANYVTIKLDTTAPASPTISLEGGAVYASAQLINANITTGDPDKTGYQMKLWGDVDGSYDAQIQPLENNSAWISFADTKQVKVSAGDGTKTIYLRLRDNVWNASSIVSDTIDLDMTAAIITCTSVDTGVISEQTGKDVSTFSFSADQPFVEYQVRYVSSTSGAYNTGSLIPTTGGSVNTSGTGDFPASTPITVQIDGTDLKAVAGADGDKIVKVFVKDVSGNWSA